MGTYTRASGYIACILGDVKCIETVGVTFICSSGSVKRFLKHDWNALTGLAGGLFGVGFACGLIYAIIRVARV